MPKFSNQLLQGLTNPTYGDKLAQVGMLLGSAPRRAREKEEEMERRKEVLTVEEQGRAAVEQGDTSALTKRINQLQQLRLDPNIKPAQDAQILSQVNALKNQQHVAKTNQKKAAATAVLNIDKALDDPSVDPRAKDAFKERRKLMLQDPEVEMAVLSHKNEINRATTAKEAADAKAYVQQNLTTILATAKDIDNPDKLEALLENTPEYARLATKQIADPAATAARQNWEFRQKQKSVKVTPDVEGIEVLASGLPEAYKAKVGTYIDELKRVKDKGLKKDGTWTLGMDTKYKNLEAVTLAFIERATIADAQTQADEVIRNDKEYKDALFTAEQAAARPADPSKIKAIATQFANMDNRDDPTKNDYNNATASYKSAQKAQYRDTVKNLNKRFGKESPVTDPMVEAIDMVSKAIGGPLTESQIRSGLENKNFTIEEQDRILSEAGWPVEEESGTPWWERILSVDMNEPPVSIASEFIARRRDAYEQ